MYQPQHELNKSTDKYRTLARPPWNRYRCWMGMISSCWGEGNERRQHHDSNDGDGNLLLMRNLWIVFHVTLLLKVDSMRTSLPKKLNSFLFVYVCVCVSFILFHSFSFFFILFHSLSFSLAVFVFFWNLISHLPKPFPKTLLTFWCWAVDTRKMNDNEKRSRSSNRLTNKKAPEEHLRLVAGKLFLAATFKWMNFKNREPWLQLSVFFPFSADFFLLLRNIKGTAQHPWLMPLSARVDLYGCTIWLLIYTV